MDEPRLIKDAQAGDVNSFNTLVLHYQDLVYNVAYRIMGDPAAADDMAQEAFIRAYKSLRRFRGGSFKAWLLRIATNACYDELRRYKRHPQSSLDAIQDVNESAAEWINENEPGPEKQQQQRELVSAVEECLETLPEEQRIVAVLCDIEAYDYKQIAEIVSVSLGTVKSRISRARSKLRDCLQGFGELIPVEYRQE